MTTAMAMATATATAGLSRPASGGASPTTQRRGGRRRSPAVAVAVVKASTCRQTEAGRGISEPNRRSALLLGAGGAVALRAPSAGGVVDDAPDEEDDDIGGFYSRWPYQKASDILPYIRQHAVAGDSESVLRAMDKFGQRYPMWKLGPEKGQMLEAIIVERDPSSVVELGTFLGYSAIRTARTLRDGARLVCVEGNSEYAAVARELLDLAGVGGRVLILEGLAADMIPEVARIVPRPGLIFEDHAKQCYTPDLLAMEARGMVTPGTWVVADNVVYPGAPGFLEHLVPENGYQTELLEAAFEYEEAWRQDEGQRGPRKDALSVSKFSGVPDGHSKGAASNRRPWGWLF